MANPQKENGYVPIANELVDAFCRLKLSPNEWQVLWCILRYSYGWNKKAAKLTYSKITELTNIASKNIARILKKLKQRGVINGNKKNLSLQKDYDKWYCYSLNRGSLNRGSLNREYTTLCLESNLASKQRVEKSENPNNHAGLQAPKDIYKDIYKDISLRERILKLWKTHFPQLRFPKDVPLINIDYFLYLVENGEVNIDKIRNIKAYVKSLTVIENDKFKNIFERDIEKKEKIKTEKREKERLEKEIREIDYEENKRKIKEIINSLNNRNALLQN